jgi:hypothetical protein
MMKFWKPQPKFEFLNEIAKLLHTSWERNPILKVPLLPIQKKNT